MQILDAAKRCFRNRGFHQTTLRDIAHEFGMSVGHIYNYFESKEAIIEALVEMQTARLIEMISEGGCYTPTSDQSDARRRLEQFVDIFMDPDSAHLAVAIMDEALINPRVYELTVDATSRVRDFIIKTHYEFGDEDQRSRFIPRVCAGETMSMDLTEPDAGSDLQRVMLKATYSEEDIYAPP